MQIITMFHKRELNTNKPLDWYGMQCCLPRQHCTERKLWKHMKETDVKILNIFGIQTVLGNADFHKESYRTCLLNKALTLDYCP